MPAARKAAQYSALIQESLTGPKRKLEYNADVSRLPCVEIAAGSIAGSATRILRKFGFSSTKRPIIDFVGPEVVERDKNTVREGSLKRALQSLKRAVVFVSSELDLSESWELAQARRRADRVYVGRREEVGSLAADIRDRREELAGQRLLN